MSLNQGVNKVLLAGCLVGRPTWRHVDGTKCLCFQFVTKEMINKQGVANEHVERHFLRIPEQLEQQSGGILKDGAQLYIEGKISTLSSIDEDGIKRYDTAVVVTRYSLFNTVSATI